MPDQQGDVRPRSLFVQLGKESRDIRRRASTVSADECRHTLPDVVLRATKFPDAAIRVTVQIDEARADNEISRVDFDLARRVLEILYRHNLAGHYANIGDHSGGGRAVDNVASADNDVKHRFSGEAVR